VIRRIGLVAILLFTGCATNQPQITIQADAAVTGRAIRHIQRGDPRYGTFDDLKNRFFSFPPPPPIVRIIPGIPGVGGTPPTLPPNANYGPLLAFLQAGPGGSVITQAHLQQLSPSLVALGQISNGNPTFTLAQLFSTPQGASFLTAAQSILQPLGLWNPQTLNNWAFYVGSRLGTLQTLLQSLFGQLIATGTPGTSGTPGIPDEFIVRIINPIQVLLEVNKLRKMRDWRPLVEHGPAMIDSVVGHLGFSDTSALIFHRRDGKYKPVAQTTIRRNGQREAWNLNNEGFFINKQTSGAGLFWQGPNDISHAYVPFEMRGGHIKVLDLIASDRAALMKRMAHGNLDLLDRASTHSTGLVQADIAFGADYSYHLRAVAGTTPFTSMGGFMGEVEYGSGIFTGRIAGGVLAESSFSNTDNLIGYVETENTIRTPYFTVQEEEGPEFKSWASTTVAAAGVMTKALSGSEVKNKRTSSPWSYQGDVRVVPELHTELDTDYTKFTLYGGVTFALVPGGDVDLGSVYKSLSFYPIRRHIGGSISLKLSAIYDSFKRDEKVQEAEKGIKGWWSEDEKNAHRKLYDMAPVDDWLLLTLEGVGEFSDLFHKARFNLSVVVYEFSVGLLTEFEHYLNEKLLDVRLGGSITYKGLYLRGLRSVKDEDYRLEAGIEITLL